jgi:twinkle protein
MLSSTLLKSSGVVSSSAKVTPEMGLGWPWPSINPLTFGIRPYTMYVFGAGTGVGKTEAMKELSFHVMREHGQEVGVIYLEEQKEKTVRSYAGKIANKRIEDPQVNDKNDPSYDITRDYTTAVADAAIDELAEMDSLIVLCNSSKSSLLWASSIS